VLRSGSTLWSFEFLGTRGLLEISRIRSRDIPQYCPAVVQRAGRKLTVGVLSQPSQRWKTATLTVPPLARWC